MNADVKKSAFNVAQNLVIVVKFTFQRVFKKLSKIIDKPAREVTKSHSSFTLSIDLIAQRENKRFFSSQKSFGRLGLQTLLSGGKTR